MSARLIEAAIICHDDAAYLGPVIAAIRPNKVTVFVSRVPWGDQIPGDWVGTIAQAKAAGAEVIEGDWPTEQEAREFVLRWGRAQGIANLLIPDSDEVLSSALLDALQRIAAVGLSDLVFCTMDTYWKSPEYVIRPRERLMPAILVSPQTVEHLHIRMYRGQRPLMLSEAHGVLHHLSYSGPESRIARKVSTWSHKDEILPNWWEEIWLRWNSERNLRDLHPTHPSVYHVAERQPIPSELQAAWESYVHACGGVDPLHPQNLEAIGKLPKVSVIIPLYGGPEDLELCLNSLESCSDLLHEVIVVDDCSPDEAPKVTDRYPFCQLARNEQNLGFAATCNHGASLATGEVLLFLNSDTIVPRPAILELLSTLERSSMIGAVGPVSNAVGHFQCVPVNYHSLDNINGFAEDLTLSDEPDSDCDMLVGFCLAVRASAWTSVGPFDERFRIGMFEDNDLCYRLRRAGFRLVVARRAFVHHKGNASLDRKSENKLALFEENKRKFIQKWAQDVECGFASHLSGLSADRIAFRPGRSPERLRESISRLMAEANVSLCMIVRNEERVLGDCLKSAAPFFSQIVVVDTGSTDRTIEIAQQHGAEVHRMVWPDSFAEARNESLKHAKGDWVCWLDADDTLPFSSGEAMLNAVLAAPPELGGIVMTVRFVTEDPEFGTSVDHVKVFRNHREFQFEGRIHEQILPSIRAHGLDVARLPVDILHSGYDVSPEGQAKKRERDAKLLKLDLQDRPGHPFVLFNLGMTAHYNGEHAEACHWLQQAVENADVGESHVRKAYALWAVSLREQGQLSEALALVHRGLAVVGEDAELLFHAGVLQTHLGRLHEAANAYRRVLQLGRGHYFSSVDSGIFGFKAHHNLANVLRDLGEVRAAMEHFDLAIQSNPRHEESIHALYAMAATAGDVERCRYCLDRMYKAAGATSQSFNAMLEHFRSWRSDRGPAISSSRHFHNGRGSSLM